MSAEAENVIRGRPVARRGRGTVSQVEARAVDSAVASAPINGKWTALGGRFGTMEMSYVRRCDGEATAFATFVPDESCRQVLKRWWSADDGPPHLTLPDLEGLERAAELQSDEFADPRHRLGGDDAEETVQMAFLAERMGLIPGESVPTLDGRDPAPSDQWPHWRLKSVVEAVMSAQADPDRNEPATVLVARSWGFTDRRIRQVLREAEARELVTIVPGRPNRYVQPTRLGGDAGDV